jgi:hypothetical protein
MIKIYTFSDKRPDFIKLQHDTFKRFIKDEYEYIVFNNSCNDIISNEIENLCSHLNIRCLPCEKNHKNAMTACYTPINFFIKNYLDDETISVIIDSDIFMINNFSFEDYIGDYDICGIFQQRNDYKTIYLWNAFVIINKNINKKKINIDFEPIDGTDVGGKTSEVLGKLNVKWVKHTADIESDESEIFDDDIKLKYDKSFGCQIIEESFIHYYRGSNWDSMGDEYHKNKTNFINYLIEKSPIRFDKKILDKHSSDKSHSYKHWNGTRYNKFRSI